MTDLFHALIQTFDQHQLNYCILAGYDNYPHAIASDVDFMVCPEDLPRLPAIVLEVAEKAGAAWVNEINHEISAAYFILAKQNPESPDQLLYLHPDASSDYHYRGQRWLFAKDILASRRLHPAGFYIPSAADGFAYYLIKKINKTHLTPEQGQQLSRRFSEDVAGCSERLRTYFPGPVAEWLIQSAQTSNWAEVAERLPALKQLMMANQPRESLGYACQRWFKDVLRRWGRYTRPTGVSIAFLGPDGCGKSTVIAAAQTQLHQMFRQVEVKHLKPGWYGLQAPGAGSGKHRVVVDPHAQPARSGWLAILKLLHFWSNYVVGYVAWLWPRRVSSRLVIFDRYFFDVQADARRYRVPQTPFFERLASILGRWVPKPDLIFILDAPVEVVRARKQEVSEEESIRQRRAYLEVGQAYENALVIDASQPVEVVVSTVLAVMVEWMRVRTLTRAGFPVDERGDPGVRSAVQQVSS